MSEPNGQEICVGVDDGFMETKVVTPNGECFRIPSHAKAGELNHISINGQGLDVVGYRTGDGDFVAGAIEHPDSTEFDGYPTSAMNRVIVAHALRVAGIPAGHRLNICTGLPVKRFYKDKQLNKELIKAKRLNLLRNDVFALPDNVRSHEIVRHEICAEGIGAWVDFIYERNEKGVLVQNSDRRKQRTAIVDVGGRTTDIAVIREFTLDLARSSTIEMGMLSVRRMVADTLNSEFSVELNNEQIHEAMTTNRVKVWSQYHDVTELVERAMKSTVQTIQAEVKRRLGSASDIDQILMVGGAIEFGQRHFQEWYPNQQFPQLPGYANARGFQKFAETTMRKA